MFNYLVDYIVGDHHSVNHRCLDIGLCHSYYNCRNPLDRHTNLALFDRMGHYCASAYE
jgi:hypothetical protein